MGTTEGYAALLMSEGMKDEAYKTAWGLYHVIYESKGLLVPDAGGLGRHGKLSRRNVHAPDGDLGAGNDATSQVVFVTSSRVSECFIRDVKQRQSGN